MAMPNFDWHTEDEGGWEEPAQGPQTAVSYTRLYPILFICCFLALTGIAIYSFLSHRVNTTTQSLENQVLASHLLLQQAARTNDRELFTSLLSSRDPNWREIQQLLFDQHLFLDRAPLGLWAVVTESQTMTVTLSPNLATAEVVALSPYKTSSNEQVFLQQTAVYERRGDTWLLSPPPDLEIFWGEWVEVQNGRFTLLYPTRDQEISKRLAEDLGELTDTLCSHMAVRCPTTGLEVRLGGDIYRLQQLNYVPDLFPTTAYDYIALPAPTLVGLPTDETGYQALYRGYAGWIGATILVRFAAPFQFTRDWVAQELTQYNLLPPVLPGVSAQTQRPPPIPFPPQDIAMLCIHNSIGRLLRYHPATQTWHDEPTGNLFMTPFISTPMIPLADDSGLLLQMQVTVAGSPHWRSILLQNGRSRLILDEQQHYNLLPWLQSKMETAEPYIRLSLTDTTKWSLVSTRLLDLSQCSEAGCATVLVDGQPTWSPDGTQSIVQPSNNLLQLYRGDERGQFLGEIGTGWSPFWLDNQTYGYIRPSNRQVELVTAVISDDLAIPDVPHTLLRAEDLLKILPEENRPAFLSIGKVMVHPTQQDWLFITAVSDDRFFLFQFDRRSGVVFLFRQLTRQGVELPQVMLTENGRFLTLAIPQTEAPNWYINVHDLDSGWLHAYPAPQYNPEISGYDWSGDGQWLVIPDDGFLRLIAPTHNYEWPVFHHISNCASVAWINQLTIND